VSKDSAANHLYIGPEKIKVNAPIEVLRNGYLNACPFPHLVIDRMFPESILDGLRPELPDFEDREHWWLENDESIVRYNLRSASELGASGFQLVSFLHSANFLYFISEITGIPNLLPDPYLTGAGYTSVPQFGYFRVHSDRNNAYETRLMRRLSLIIYLNKDWLPEYGGELQLYNSRSKDPEVCIAPIYNRMIIFDTSAGNLHGVSTVTCPDGRSRDAFLTYIHTVGIGDKLAVPARGTIYAPSFYGPPDRTLKRMIKNWTPPVVYRALRNQLQRRKPKP
jgi:2OG-Fe(II) oxygenase superfamily